MHRRAIGLILVLLVLAGLTFALWPGLDLATSRLFFVGGRFIGEGPPGNAARFVGWFLPACVLIGALAGWLARLAGIRAPSLPQTRTALYLALTMALGPGLLVNVVLKDHWHRPRPVQVTQFGGHFTFRPWDRLDGACVRNCSFVSGEASSATWMLAPALLVPAPLTGPAVAASLVFGAAVGFLRITFGGHFLSDTLFSMLLTALVILLLHRLMWRGKQPD
ncbi:MAG: hypothetical protein B7Z80_25880 [Rhodospirillales bacterium 20-64-7]|nr:MAG: hypothetical protein B7Z80_25880 [Rhodospirillales bacterium 20-64-7]